MALAFPSGEVKLNRPSTGQALIWQSGPMMRLGTDTFRGSFCALATPFRGGEVDADAFAKFVRWHLGQGTNGLVPCGTTGESPNLSGDEQDLLIEICLEGASRKIPVIAGTGSNSTAASIVRTRRAEELGADAAMLVVPYYNKPSQEGLFQHFKVIAEATDLPLLVYNVPGRTVTDLSVETLGRLSEIPNIVGVKDATANMDRVALQAAACGADFIQLSGDDFTAREFNTLGGVGCISVTANIAPSLNSKLQAASLSGDAVAAREIDEKLMPLHEALFLESSPSPTKYGLSLMGLAAEEIRLPLVVPSEATKSRVAAVMASLGLIEG